MAVNNVPLNGSKAKRDPLTLVLDFIDTFSDWAGKLISLLVILMVFVVLFLIIQRQIGAHWSQFVGTAGAYNPDEEELPFFTSFIIVYFTLGAGYTLHHDTFVNFDVFERRLSPRWRASLRILTYPLFFLAFAFILHGAIGDLVELIEEGEEAAFGAQTELMTLTGYTDVWTLYAWVIGVALLLLEGLSRYIRSIMVLVSGGKQNA